MNKIINYNLAEFTLMFLIFAYSIGNAQPDIPSGITLCTIAFVVIYKIKFLGVLIGFVMQLISIVLLLALISEASEFYEINTRYIELIAIGSGFTLLIAACGTVLVYKYGYHFFKILIGD